MEQASTNPSSMLEPLEDILRLAMVPGIGPRLYQQLVECFGSPAAVLAASLEDLLQVRGIGGALARAIREQSPQIDVAHELALCQQRGIAILSQADPRFPAALLRIADPPPVLFCQGQLLPRDALAIAIVGTRHPTTYGKRQAERLATSLARMGFTIVSGLARGIDAVAHQAALRAGGRTLAVLGSGLSEIYPHEHSQLAQEIITSGALLSEFTNVSHLSPGVFPRRNRIISGLCLGVLVIEAGIRSGALITARHALDQNREVMALPGSVESRASRGCHALLRDGATLVETADDVLQALGPLAEGLTTQGSTTNSERQLRHPRELQLNPQEVQVLQAIELQPTSVDSVISQTGLPPARVLATLSALEVRRLIRRLSGQFVCRI